jgi:hypothetical protein
VAEVLKLSALLPDRLDRIGEQARKKLCETEEIGCMKLAWDFIAGELAGALKSALDCDLLKLLAKGWAEAELLSEFADPKKHPPGTRSVLEIGEHTLKRELHPVVAVTVASLPCVELKFTLVVTAHFSGVKLSVLDGHVTGGSLGEAWASAQLSYEGAPLHEAAESKKLPMPGTFAFEAPGVPIPRVGWAGTEALLATPGPP